jgi:superfamily II DNA or RNA helicase
VSGSFASGQFGGHKRDTLRDHNVLVATVHSASQQRLMTAERRGLLIADECHHYGVQNWSGALQQEFHHRLGLSATYDRDDNGVAEYLDPYFGHVCYSVEYGEALADNVIAHFKVAFIGVAFTPEEKTKYEESAEKTGRYRNRLIHEFGVAREPFGEFMRQVCDLSAEREPDLSLRAYTSRPLPNDAQ